MVSRVGIIDGLTACRRAIQDMKMFWKRPSLISNNRRCSIPSEDEVVAEEKKNVASIC